MAKPLVFISHSGTDTWIARQISRECRLLGADTFLDEAEIAVGEDFESAIFASLKRASELLVLVTPWSLNRPYVWMEIGAACMNNLPIVMILHGVAAADLQENSKIPVSLKKRNLIDINQIDRYFKELMSRVEDAEANEPK